MNNFIKKHNIKIIFIVIILVQILTIVYATSERVILHIDEYLSFGFISSENMYVHGKPDFYDTWHSNEYYLEYLEVNENEQSNFAPVYDNQKNDVHPPLYYLLLRIFCNFNIDNFSIWPAIALNIVLYIISICIVYLIGKKLFNNKKYSLLLCFFVGFNIGILQTVIFIRMYQLLILASLLLLYWHLCKKDKEKLEFKDSIQLVLIVCMGFLTHYYFSVLAVGFYINHVIRKLKVKQFKEIFKYTITLILAVVLCTIIFPCWIDHIFSSGRGEEAMTNMSMRPHYLLKIIHLYIDVLNTDAFNNFLYALVAVLSCFALGNLYYKIKLKNINNNEFTNKLKSTYGMSYVILPSIFYFFVVACLMPYLEIRYFSPILVPIIIFILYYLKVFGEKLFKNEKYTFLIITVVCIISTLISVVKVDDNIFTFKKYESVMEDIKKNSNVNLIYVINTNTAEFYNSYEVLLNYENTRFVKYDENIIQEIKAIIEDRNLSEQEYMIGIDSSLHQEFMNKLSRIEGFGDLEFGFRLGANFFYTLQN